jgi:hypothetical protein
VRAQSIRQFDQLNENLSGGAHLLPEVQVTMRCHSSRDWILVLAGQVCCVLHQCPVSSMQNSADRLQAAVPPNIAAAQFVIANLSALGLFC